MFNSRGYSMAAMKLLAGNSNRALAEAIAAHLGVRFADPWCGVSPTTKSGSKLSRERARRGRLRHPVHLLSGQRQPDGAADLHRRAEARLGAADHGGDALFRLCAAGSQDRAAHADLGQARRQSDHPRRRRPGADRRSARRPDPGLLRHPDRQSVRHAGDGRATSRIATQRSTS